MYELGLEPALDWLSENVSNQHDINIDFVDDKKTKNLDTSAKILLFQSVRELLVNIVKHSYSEKALVKITSDDSNKQIRIDVEDEGKGFNPEDTLVSQGFGLFSIRERLKKLGGEMKIDSEPFKGTRVSLISPSNGIRKSKLAG